jgi:indole-3-glycerol phosphate synthase
MSPEVTAPSAESRATYLDAILEWHRQRAAARTVDLSALKQQALQVSALQPLRAFAASLWAHRAATHQPAVIAEIKRRSPSKGDLAPDLDPAAIAVEYAAGGAAALSVLTDNRHFGGSPEDLHEAREATDLPVLRKDFTVCEADVLEARIMGADAVLLIVAALTDDELHRFLALATGIGLDALVEVHDEAEAGRAVSAGARIIGVNQRDLRTFALDTERALRVAAALPDTVLRVAESGIGTVEDARRLGRAGYDAILVGESLVRSTDRAAAVAALIGVNS